MVVARFTCGGTNDGPLGPFPATGRQWTLPICEMWHFDADGSVVGGEIYYDQAALLAQLGLLPESGDHLEERPAADDALGRAARPFT
jgi:SnoaL-like polyketide cyclase